MNIIWNQQSEQLMSYARNLSTYLKSFKWKQWSQPLQSHLMTLNVEKSQRSTPHFHLTRSIGLSLTLEFWLREASAERIAIYNSTLTLTKLSLNLNLFSFITRQLKWVKVLLNNLHWILERNQRLDSMWCTLDFLLEAYWSLLELYFC